MNATATTDKSVKRAATAREYRRVYDNMCLPPRDIVAECRDGMWIREAWTNGRAFGWGKWHRA